MHVTIFVLLIASSTLYLLAVLGEIFKTGWWFPKLIKRLVGITTVCSENGEIYVDAVTKRVYSDKYVEKLYISSLKRITKSLLVPCVTLVCATLSIARFGISNLF